MKSLILSETIQRKIFILRGHKVMLDRDLAELYGVKIKSLNLAVKRNRERFPDDFMFQISRQEFEYLRFQFETLNVGRGKHRKYRPYAFTEQGVAMLSSVLNSKRAIHVNIQIMRTFTRLREKISHHKELSRKLAQLERQVKGQGSDIASLFEAIRQLMESPDSQEKKIGFRAR